MIACDHNTTNSSNNNTTAFAAREFQRLEARVLCEFILNAHAPWIAAEEVFLLTCLYVLASARVLLSYL